jgi:serine/threonine-protein kinase
MRCITRASESALADLAWIERCPLLEPLRGRPEMNEAHQRVLLRVRDIWVDGGW